jgi:hypothetical protein
MPATTLALVECIGAAAHAGESRLDGGHHPVDGSARFLVEENPFLQFVPREARPDDKLVVGWLDNRRARHSGAAMAL